MIDILAPLALLAMVGFVVAIVLSARRQRRERMAVFEELAEARGWRYLPEDDGTAQSLSGGFEGFARFRSPSLGRKVPRAVVTGAVKEGRLCVFLHATREYEGNARQWTICLVEAPAALGPAMRIIPRGVARVHQLGGEPRLELGDARFDEHFEVRTSEEREARRRLPPTVRERLLDGSRRLPFPVEVQVRDRRLAAYPARRNDEAESVRQLQALVDFARALTRALQQSGA